MCVRHLLHYNVYKRDVHLFDRLRRSVYLMMAIDSYQNLDWCLSNYHITIKFYHAASIAKKSSSKIYQVHYLLTHDCRNKIFCHNIGTYQLFLCAKFQLLVSIGSELIRSNDFDSYQSLSNPIKKMIEFDRNIRAITIDYQSYREPW